MQTSLRDYTIEVFDEIPSTNTYLMEKAKKENITKNIVLARSQTGGRGRMGRTFYSPMDAGLYMSLLLPLASIEESEGLTLRIGVALYHALKEMFPSFCPSLKWVNDIYVGDRKLAGILVEGVRRVDGTFCAVVGIGINFLKSSFPEELAPRVTSVEDEIGEKCLPFSFVTPLVLAIEKEWNASLSSVIATYRQHSYLQGKTLTVLPYGKEEYTAEYVDIDENGALVVRTEQGEEQHLFTGDVSVKPVKM